MLANTIRAVLVNSEVTVIYAARKFCSSQLVPFLYYILVNLTVFILLKIRYKRIAFLHSIICNSYFAQNPNGYLGHLSVQSLDSDALHGRFDHTVDLHLSLLTGKPCFQLWCGSAPEHTFNPRDFCLNIVNMIKCNQAQVKRQRNQSVLESQVDRYKDQWEVERRGIHLRSFVGDGVGKGSVSVMMADGRGSSWVLCLNH